MSLFKDLDPMTVLWRCGYGELSTGKEVRESLS